MKRKIFAIAGALLLGVVALFTLMHLLKAALGLAVLFLAGRGLMRLWGGGRGMRGHRFSPQPGAYPVLGGHPSFSHSRTNAPVQNPTASPGIVPIW